MIIEIIDAGGDRMFVNTDHVVRFWDGRHGLAIQFDLTVTHDEPEYDGQTWFAHADHPGVTARQFADAWESADPSGRTYPTIQPIEGK